MTPGLTTTFALLAKTKNEAADEVLLPGLESDRSDLRIGALRALLERHSEAGHREIVNQWHNYDDERRTLVKEFRGSMTAALRHAVLSFETQLCRNGCDMVLDSREYDLAPALINASEDETNPNRGLTARALLQSIEMLYEELDSPGEQRGRRDPVLVRQHILGSLEQSVQRYYKHRVGEVLEAFLLLVDRDNLCLRGILSDPRSILYLPTAEILSHSPRAGIVRLVLSFLDDSQPPSAAMTLLAYRNDAAFVEALLKKVGTSPSPNITQNFHKLEHIAWLQSEELLLHRLADEDQSAAVCVALASGVNRRTVYKLIETMLVKGQPAGRLAAAQGLAQFNGVDANTLALKALADEDPAIQAAIVPQLRQRGIPGAVSKLIQLLESPHTTVQLAARESLAEFSFNRYLSAFDGLDDEVRRSTGRMVCKVDPAALQLLVEELESGSRTRRLRAISMAAVMGLILHVEQQLHERLLDEDHLVRAEAARKLALCDTEATHVLLREAMADRSLVVREAAEISLRAMKQPIIDAAPLPPPPPWQEVAL
ncbi:MAG: HEAT repeat domain-containing protein [Planctomycetota bacterium]|nr:HEAT repeat domain-containing protein [Planctomycetota bacterium]